MGNKLSVNKINYEDMQHAIDKNYIIINTMNEQYQGCLIQNTIISNEEEEKINGFLSKNLSTNIVLYGMNNIDETVFKKYNQLIQLGFSNVFIYIGGIFEWLLLQDIYGEENFPTTSNELDIIKYKGKTKLNYLLTNG